MDTATSNRKGHMILKIELTDTEYHGLMHTLKRAANDWSSFDSGIDSLELLHLMTLLAEASITEGGRCKACDQTAKRCTDWGGSCCPLCKHNQKVSS